VASQLEDAAITTLKDFRDKRRERSRSRSRSRERAKGRRDDKAELEVLDMRSLVCHLARLCDVH